MLGGFGARTVQLVEQRSCAGNVDQRSPAKRQAHGQVHEQVGVDVDQAGGGVRAFEVAAEPIDPLGDPGQNGAVHSSSTTQVSLLPPPWDELTTVEPLRKATRVSPPVLT